VWEVFIDSIPPSFPPSSFPHTDTGARSRMNVSGDAIKPVLLIKCTACGEKYEKK
jgi:hypothetical protein